MIGNGMDYAEGRITLDQYNMGQGEALGEAGSMYAMARVARGGGAAEPITLKEIKTTIGNAAQRLKSVAGDFAEGYRANSRGINFTSGGMQNALEGIEGGIKNVLSNIHPKTGNTILAEVEYGSNIDYLVEGSKPSTKGRLVKTHQYENPGTHDPSGGTQRYNPGKSVLPKNHVELFESSKPFLCTGQ